MTDSLRTFAIDKAAFFDNKLLLKSIFFILFIFNNYSISVRKLSSIPLFYKITECKHLISAILSINSLKPPLLKC